MKTNFRSVTRAHRSGWYLVEMGIDDRNKHTVSHFGLMIWSDKNCQGRYVANYQDGYKSRFAFENIEDAAFFKLRWS
jgi:hypothetical protein